MSEPELVYGRLPVLEALRAGEPLLELLVAEGAAAQGPLGEALALARQAGVPIRRLRRPALDRQVAGAGSGNHQGVVALLGAFAYSDLDTILARAIRADEPPWLLALDEVQDVHNLGSLLRSAEAVGVHGVLLGEHRAAGVTAAVRKASAGAVAWLAVARVDLAAALDSLRARGLAVVGLDQAGDAPYAQLDLAGPLVLVVGGEGRGLTKAIHRRCDSLVALPMHGHVASLNVAVAGSVVLYEALRQRAPNPAPRGPAPPPVLG